MFGGNYNVPKLDPNMWKIGLEDSERLQEAEMLLSSILDFVNDIPDVDKVSNENYVILQRLAGRIEQFLGDD